MIEIENVSKSFGKKKYSYLIRYLNNYATDEEQVFMLKKGIRKNKDFVIGRAHV